MSNALDAMTADIEEIDAIIGQFLDFARGADEQKEEHELGEVLGSSPSTTRASAKDLRFNPPPGEAVPLRAHGGAPRRGEPGGQRAALRGEPWRSSSSRETQRWQSRCATSPRHSAAGVERLQAPVHAP